ncbi:survival of motor neuron-related-splicing factor 30 [Rhipicephalus sanguineus]|uniref:survival of motor neuron-related-splicing factor 30 n=1 Tax=Rhipicephalus sanguineus TaxID=34632 RepID=UPI001894E0D9|nr:survival of motor neuron-related-splicing factor 30 [Rhipicephalus sanguineus]
MALDDPTASLQNYQVQLQQVEAALTNDPDDKDLLKLKEDLLEVISLTLNLISTSSEEQTEKQGSGESSKRPGGEASGSKDDAVGWFPGDKCLALWKDGQYYDATIDDIIGEGQATVTFTAYGNTIIQKLSQLKAHKNKRSMNNVIEGGPKTKKQLLLAEREYKKKKAQKKAVRLKQIEEDREKEKNKWQEFNSKAFNKNKKGQVKKSIFASPDNVNGRVGVGTCGIGGRPMTEFHHQEKWRKQAGASGSQGGTPMPTPVGASGMMSLPTFTMPSGMPSPAPPSIF